MTSKERVLAAVNHQLPDRMPIAFDAEEPVKKVLHRHFGTSTKEQLWDALHVDTWFVGPGAKLNLGKTLTNGDSVDRWGVTWRTAQYDGGTYTDVVGNPLKGDITLADIEKHPWPPLDYNDFTVVPAKARNQKDRAVVASTELGPFFRGSFVRGMDELLMDMVVEPDRAHALLGKVWAIQVHQVKELMRHTADDIDFYYISDDFCMQQAPMMPPYVFREFLWPLYKEIGDIVHDNGVKFFFHCCGAVRPLIPMLLEAGVDMLEPIQTRATGMEVEGLKRDFGDRLAFYGSVDLQDVMVKGTVETVREEVRKNMLVLGAGGGFVVGPGHTYFQPDAPLENILEMYRVAYEEGTYSG